MKDLAALMKLKLSFLVVLSAVLGYFMGTSSPQLAEVLALALGGVLLTGGSNGFNQIWERNQDALMNRTKHRPLPSGSLSVSAAVIWCLFISIAGITILWTLLNPFCGILGMLALYSYVFLYTPLKRVNSINVTVGAFPGAIPPMLGYVAASGSFGLEPGLLFALQWMWQFPHFWAIAWVAKGDYDKGGFKMLPFNLGKTRFTAWYIALSALMLIPVSIIPWFIGNDGAMIGNIAGISTLILGVLFFLAALRFAITLKDSHAKTVMFGSFIYLPVVQILFVLDKI
ncbi:MAG: heme o synthase [Flavobacteriales bacterium]